MGNKIKVVLRNVEKAFEDPRRGTRTVALHDISIDIREGEFLCLLGPSGCGKSTVLNLIAGFEAPTQGQVLIDGKPVEKPGLERGMIFQTADLFPWLTVMENITFGPRLAGVDKNEYIPAAERYVRLMGLVGFERHYPYELSGGMRQRVALARVWITEPSLFLMDEPFGALDAQTRLLMQELLLRLWHDAQRTSLFVTHDVDEGIFLGDRILLMSAHPGEIREAVDLPFTRPRVYDDLIFRTEYTEIKQHVLHALREESQHLIDTHANE